MPRPQENTIQSKQVIKVMQVSVKFFASIKEQLDCADLPFEVAEGATIDALCIGLAEHSVEFERVFMDPDRSLKFSINYELAQPSDRLQDGDEVAVFPPVTGG